MNAEIKGIVSGEVKLNEVDLMEAVKHVAKEISDRYRNGVTILYMLPDTAMYAHLVSKELDRLKCRHMCDPIAVHIVMTNDNKQQIVISPLPSVHLTKGRSVVILDAVLDKNSRLKIASEFILRQERRPSTAEVASLLVAAEEIPKWMQPMYVGFQIPENHGELIGFGIGDEKHEDRNSFAIRELKVEPEVLQEEVECATV